MLLLHQFFFLRCFSYLSPTATLSLVCAYFFFSFHISGLINLSIIASTPRDALYIMFLDRAFIFSIVLFIYFYLSDHPFLARPFFVFIIFPPFFSTLPLLPDILGWKHFCYFCFYFFYYYSVSLRFCVKSFFHSFLRHFFFFFFLFALYVYLFIFIFCLLEFYFILYIYFF